MKKIIAALVVAFWSMTLGPPAASSQQAQDGFKGSFPIVWLQCQFGDDLMMPYPREYYESLISAEYPGAAHFWEKVSWGQVNFRGSTGVLGPFIIRPRPMYPQEVSEARDQVFQDCAAAADQEVYFPAFAGIGLFLSNTITVSEQSAFGGSGLMKRDRASKVYAVMWLPPWVDNYAIAHELGHGVFGFLHSLGLTGEADSPWDIMSQMREREMVHPIGVHKQKAGWVAPDRIYVPVPGRTETVRLEHLASVAAGGYLLVEIPVIKNVVDKGDNVSYLAEVRRQEDEYDRGIPYPAALVHKAGVRFEPMLMAVMNAGDTFFTENGARVTVISEDPTGAFIEIDASAMPTVPALEVISPAAGEMWKVGSTQTIRWTGANGQSTEIWLSLDGGRSGWLLLAGGIFNTGAYSWEVKPPASNEALIVVSSGESEGVSDLFAIVKKEKRGRRSRR